MSVRDMQRGKERARRERRKEATRRVAAYKAWLRAGCPPSLLPDIPSDTEFKLARGAR